MVHTFNRVVVLCLLVLSALSVQAAEIGREILPSKVLGEDRPLNIVLPKGYSPESGYPVVFALDGDQEHVMSFASRMHAVRPELIVVGVENVDRSRDMFPNPASERGGRGGGGRLFLEFLTSELIPHIEKTYATNGHRTLSGQSNSGFFVLFAMATSPDAFDAYLASSPMIGWDWELIRTGTNALLEDHSSLPKALYLNHGEFDSDRTVNFLPRYVDLLEAAAPRDFRWKFDVVEGGEHVPETSYGDGIAFIFGSR